MTPSTNQGQLAFSHFPHFCAKSSKAKLASGIIGREGFSSPISVVVTDWIRPEGRPHTHSHTHSGLYGRCGPTRWKFVPDGFRNQLGIDQRGISEGLSKSYRFWALLLEMVVRKYLSIDDYGKQMFGLYVQ